MHHTGCLVRSIDEALDFYRATFGADKISPKIFVSSQKVNVCFIEIGPEVYIELVESADEESAVGKNMMKKGISYYHIGYMVDDFDKTMADLDELGCRHLDTFHSEAFNNKRCAFLYDTNGCLIEIIENPQ
jgi:methylmalonyl-CoA epimerase